MIDILGTVIDEEISLEKGELVLFVDICKELFLSLLTGN
jgi:hypothetical protein